MKTYKLYLTVFIAALCSLCLFPATIYSQTFPDSTADRVIGQPDFVTGTSGLSQTKLNIVLDVALDTTVSPPILYISDYQNGRILGYYNYPFIQTNAPADFVIGQTDFVTNTTGTTDSKLSGQCGIAADNNGNLWIADMGNNRVLVFISPTTTDFTADYVFGQGGSFITGTANNGGISDSSLAWPVGISFDNQNRVYISELANNRILIFNDPLNTDFAADYVIGQSDFSSNGSSCTDSTLNNVYGCAAAANGDLFVVDKGNHRVLKYIDPINTDKKADQVFGQGGSFTTNTANNPSLNAEAFNTPVYVYLDKYENLYISDQMNNRILVFEAPLDTTADYVYGQDGSFTTGTSGVSADSLYEPRGILVDEDGNLLVSEYQNHRILKFL